VLIVRRRLAAVAALAVTLLVTLAGPAGAAPVLADDQFKWFYWAGPLLVLSLIGIVILIGIGYYVRVLRPKYKGQKQS